MPGAGPTCRTRCPAGAAVADPPASPPASPRKRGRPRKADRLLQADSDLKIDDAGSSSTAEPGKARARRTRKAPACSSTDSPAEATSADAWQEASEAPQVSDKAAQRKATSTSRPRSATSTRKRQQQAPTPLQASLDNMLLAASTPSTSSSRASSTSASMKRRSPLDNGEAQAQQVAAGSSSRTDASSQLNPVYRLIRMKQLQLKRDAGSRSSSPVPPSVLEITSTELPGRHLASSGSSDEASSLLPGQAQQQEQQHEHEHVHKQHSTSASRASSLAPASTADTTAGTTDAVDTTGTSDTDATHSDVLSIALRRHQHRQQQQQQQQQQASGPSAPGPSIVRMDELVSDLARMNPVYRWEAARTSSHCSTKDHDCCHSRATGAARGSCCCPSTQPAHAAASIPSAGLLHHASAVLPRTTTCLHLPSFQCPHHHCPPPAAGSSVSRSSVAGGSRCWQHRCHSSCAAGWSSSSSSGGEEECRSSRLQASISLVAALLLEASAWLLAAVARVL